MIRVTIHDGQQTTEVTTGSNGSATTNASSGASYVISAWSGAHNFLTLDGVQGNDFILPLSTLSTPSRAGGLKGAVDMSQITTTGDLAYSVSGASFATPLFLYDPADLFGQDVHQVDIMVGGGFQLPVGASATMSVNAFGMNFNLKDSYYTEAAQGLRAAWSFGGRVDFDFLGGFGSENLLASILPNFQRFQHDVRPSIQVVSVPKVVDIGDVDNDSDMSELVPDYANFPDVSLTPEMPQTLRYLLDTNNARLPFVEGGNADTMLLVSGTILPGIGFVPLGLDGLTDDSGNGLVPSFTAKLAPPHSGLELGDFAVLATAYRNTDSPLPEPGSTRIFVSNQLPQTVDFSSGWIDAPLGGTHTLALRNLTLTAPQNTDILHFTIQHEDGAWDYYTSASAQSWTLPAVPSGIGDRVSSATVTVDAIDLVNNVTLDNLFEVDSGGVTNLDRAIQGVSRAKIQIN